MFLSAKIVLPLAGYPETHKDGKAALAYAEELITSYTGLTFGKSETGKIVTVNTVVKTMFLELPLDVTAVTGIAPALAGGESFVLSPGKLERKNETGLLPWNAAYYQITVTRGIQTVPPVVNKAASLLVAHYLQLSDAERSKYLGTSQGDFSGTMRFDELPVPEASQLLRMYRSSVRMGVA
jgi:hypothetical protein